MCYVGGERVVRPLAVGNSLRRGECVIGGRPSQRKSRSSAAKLPLPFLPVSPCSKSPGVHSHSPAPGLGSGVNPRTMDTKNISVATQKPFSPHPHPHRGYAAATPRPSIARRSSPHIAGSSSCLSATAAQGLAVGRVGPSVSPPYFLLFFFSISISSKGKGVRVKPLTLREAVEDRKRRLPAIVPRGDSPHGT